MRGVRPSLRGYADTCNPREHDAVDTIDSFAGGFVEVPRLAVIR